MILHNMIAGYGHAKYAILIMVMLLIASVTSTCQTDQITPTAESVEPTDFPAGFPTPDPEILAACLADGGRWEVLGFSGPGCNLPTSDGGKACQDSEECESGCLGDPNLVMRKEGYGQLTPDHERMDELNTENVENVVSVLSGKGISSAECGSKRAAMWQSVSIKQWILCNRIVG